MGSYVSVTNDTKDLAMTYLGPDMKVLQISIGVLAGLLVVVPGVGEVMDGTIVESVDAAVDDGMVTTVDSDSVGTLPSGSDGTIPQGLSESGSSWTDYMTEASEEDRGWFRNKLRSATFRLTSSSDGTTDIESEVEGYDELPDVPEPRVKGQPWTRAMVTKGMVASAILEGFAQGIIHSYKKHHYHVVMPGHTLKSGKKSMSLLMQYNAVKISHNDKELHCWTSEHAVWSGKTINSVNKYYLSDHHFHWKKTEVAKLNIKNKLPAVSAAVVVPNTKGMEVEPAVVQSSCCLPTLLSRSSAAATVIKEDDIKNA